MVTSKRIRVTFRPQPRCLSCPYYTGCGPLDHPWNAGQDFGNDLIIDRPQLLCDIFRG